MASNVTNQEYYDTDPLRLTGRVYPRSFTIKTALLIPSRYFIHNSSHVIIFLVCQIARHILKNTLLITYLARPQTHARLIERHTARSKISERRRTAYALAISNAQTLAGDKRTRRSPGCGRQNIIACLTFLSPTSSQLQKQCRTYCKHGPIRPVDLY